MKKFDQFSRHLEVLQKADQEDLENEFIISGIIDKFYIQFELGWKVLKELLAYEGRSIASIGSPREIIFWENISEDLPKCIRQLWNDTVQSWIKCFK